MNSWSNDFPKDKFPKDKFSKDKFSKDRLANKINPQRINSQNINYRRMNSRRINSCYRINYLNPKDKFQVEEKFPKDDNHALVTAVMKNMLPSECSRIVQCWHTVSCHIGCQVQCTLVVLTPNHVKVGHKGLLNDTWPWNTGIYCRVQWGIPKHVWLRHAKPSPSFWYPSGSFMS